MNIKNDNFSYDDIWQKLSTFNPQTSLLIALIHLGTLLKEMGNKHIFSPFGIGVEEFEALFIIAHHEVVRPSDLVKKSFMHPAKITRVLDRLEQRGMIERMPAAKDRRSFVLRITSQGEAFLSTVKETLEQRSERPFLEVTEDEYTVLQNTIVKMMNFLRRKRHE